MHCVYVLQEKTGYVVAATYEEPKAIQLCKDKGWTYRLVPFYSCEGTKIKVIAGPIPKELLPGSERTLMGDFKPDAY
jgi:hypothetical protein